jgi:hypothetical protein
MAARSLWTGRRSNAGRTHPEPAIVYTDRFLPPPAERMPPKGMN